MNLAAPIAPTLGCYNTTNFLLLQLFLEKLFPTVWCSIDRDTKLSQAEIDDDDFRHDVFTIFIMYTTFCICKPGNFPFPHIELMKGGKRTFANF